MRLNRSIAVQLGLFLAVSLTAFAVMGLGYMKLPTLLFGVGRYDVTLELPSAGGLYERSNVTYRGTEVGLVKSVGLTDSGVVAQLSLRSDIPIPSDLKAEVHSQSAVGEQYVELLPKAASRPLKNGDVISLDRTTVPPPIDSLLDSASTGLQGIPGDNLRTTIDEAYTAFGGLGPDLSRLIRASTTLASDARKNLDAITTLTDKSAPVLQTQTDTADSVQAWASHLATITNQLRDKDEAVTGILQNGPQAADEGRQLLDRVNVTLPVLLANLVSIEPVLVTYRDNLEQILVLLPQGTAAMQGIGAIDRNLKGPYKGGAALSFNLNFNVPPPCTTGFLPPQQQRTPNFEDAPDPPPGLIYCRVPQDSQLAVRGIRNTPCVTHPGKRAPTVKMCESDENYVPLNNGYIWKGDANATLTGQSVPQLDPGEVAPPAVATPPPPAASPPPPAPIATATYDPANGQFVGPDGVHTQSNLAPNSENQTWQSMLVPPEGK